MVHGCMVYTERAKMAAVSRGISYTTTKQPCKFTTSVDIQKRVIKSYNHSFRIACDKSAVSLPESEEQR